MKNIQSKLNTLAIAAIALATISITSCKKSSGPSITPIAGYDSSGAVAPANLIAYYPFDGNSNDAHSGTQATAVNVTYTTGIKGMAYQGGANTYATLVPNSSFSNMGSYSLSLWYKLPAQPVVGDPAGLFFLSGTLNPNLLLYELEPYSPVSGDSVKIHHGFFDVISPAYQGFTMESYDTAAINQWVHVVTTYDGSSSTYVIYQDGVAIGNNSAFGTNLTPTLMYTDATKATPLGSLGWGNDTPVQIVIGTWPAGLYGVSPTLGSNGCFIGQLDEVRVYNKALSLSEVAGLYLNGKAGR